MFVPRRGIDLADLPDAAAQCVGRQRIEIQDRPDRRVHTDVGQHAADGNHPVVRIRVGYGRDSRLGQALDDAFVVDEEERLVRFDRAADAAAELVLAERRLGSGRVVEELARVEGAVAHKLQHRSMDRVGARPGDRIDRGAAAAKLRAVGVGQGLELGDRFDAEGRAEHARPGGTVPEVRRVLVVEQERLSLGSSSRHRVDGLPAK